MVRMTKTSSLILIVIGALAFFTLVYTFTGDSADPNQRVKLTDLKDLTLFKKQFGHEKGLDGQPQVPSSKSSGKTKVYSHNGQELERLNDFCTWSLPMDCASLKTPGGDLTIYILDVEDDPGLSGILKKTGIRDPDNVNIVIRELEKYPDAGFFDFGSHIGVYGLSIAHTLGRQVICIDPMIENMARLCKSVQKNGFTDKVQIVFNAISNEHTTVNFKRVHKHIGATTVEKSSVTDKSACDDSVHHTVMMDDLIPIIPFKTAVIKLDVEKSEYFAIQGGQKFLQAIDVKCILMEWYNIEQTEHAGPLVELMKQLKYVPYLPEVDGKHKRLEYADHSTWRKHRFLLDILWVKE